jgi:LEA14-like dessication related protein
VKKVLSVLAVSAAVVTFGACAMLGRQAFQQPVVNLRSVAVRGVGLTGGTLDVKLSVFNPNHYRLDATQLRYTVNLAGDSIRVASGTMDSRFTVNDRDSSIVTIPVDFTYNGIGAAGRSLINTGAVTYHVHGDVTVGSPVGSFTVPFSQVGRFTSTGVAK